MAKQYGQKTITSFGMTCRSCNSWMELQAAKGTNDEREQDYAQQLTAEGWHMSGGERWHCPDCHAVNCQ